MNRAVRKKEGIKDMHPARILPRLFLPAALMGIILASLAVVPVSAQEREMLKGTVKSFEPGVLVLKDVSGGEDPLTRRDVKVLCDAGTVFYYGAVKVPKEEIVPGCLVLVKWEPAGPERKALMVRVIRGKAQ